jgi:hypothetical protein
VADYDSLDESHNTTMSRIIKLENRLLKTEMGQA